MVEDGSSCEPATPPGSFADTSGQAEGCRAYAPIAQAGCLSAIVTAVVAFGFFSGPVSESLGVAVFAFGALVVSLPIVSAVLLAIGKRYAAKVLFGVWLGLLVPSLVVFFLAYVVIASL